MWPDPIELGHLIGVASKGKERKARDGQGHELGRTPPSHVPHLKGQQGQAREGEVQRALLRWTARPEATGEVRPEEKAVDPEVHTKQVLGERQHSEEKHHGPQGIRRASP